MKKFRILAFLLFVLFIFNFASLLSKTEYLSFGVKEVEAQSTYVPDAQLINDGLSSTGATNDGTPVTISGATPEADALLNGCIGNCLGTTDDGASTVQVTKNPDGSQDVVVIDIATGDTYVVHIDNGGGSTSTGNGSTGSNSSTGTSGGPTNTPPPPGSTNTPFPTRTPTPTFTPTPTPTPIPRSWIKIKNGSFTSKGDLDNSIPPQPPLASCDAQDDGSRYFINGTAPGVASANNIILGTAPVSTNDWKATGYTKQAVLSASTFVEYLKARKTYQTITSLDSLTADGLYVWGNTTTYPFPDATATEPNVTATELAKITAHNIVLIVPGEVKIMTNFTSANSVALLANKITFDAAVTSATGIFIADIIDTSTTVNSGLTITGNLIATTTLTHNREYAAPGCPTLFIDFRAAPYMDLLPYLSVAKYEWRQLQ